MAVIRQAHNEKTNFRKMQIIFSESTTTQQVFPHNSKQEKQLINLSQNDPQKIPLNFNDTSKIIQLSRVEVPKLISSEQRYFRVLRFLNADSENMKNISTDQLCLRADQLRFSLNQRCSELKNSALFQRESAQFLLAMKHWAFSAYLRWITSHIITCRWEYKFVIT